MKLHLGCGKRNFGSDWINIDGGDYPHLYSKDITKLPFESDIADLIYASHVLEYFDREEVIPVLKEWNRVLKPNGILRLAVPDFAAMVQLYLIENYFVDNFLGPLYGKMKMGDQTIYHKTCYDFDSLQAILQVCGFYNVKSWDWRQVEHGIYDDCSQAYLPKMDKENGTLISLNVEANKA